MTRKYPLVWRRYGGGAWSTFFYRGGSARLLGHCLGRAGKVYMVGANGETGIWDPVARTLTEQTTTGKICGNVAQTLKTAPWASSTGAIFCTAKENTASGNSLYRTTDFVTWTKVLDIIADLGPGTATDDKVNSMTEADNGWLFGCTYGALSDGLNARALIRSKDDGVTWEKLTSFPAATLAPRHMHAVVWDPYRSVLWAMGGDKHPDSKVCYSTDYGDTFTPWPNTWQCTGLIPLPGGVILISDDNLHTYGFNRIPGATLAELIEVDFTYLDHIAYNPITQSPLHRAGLTQLEAGFGWWGWHSVYGTTYAALCSVADAGHLNTVLEGVLAGSCEEDGSDDCPIWQPIDWSSKSWGGDNTNASPPNYYDTLWDGWHYMIATSDVGPAAAWRVIPPDFVIHVDQAGGREFGLGTEDDPINWWPDDALPRVRRIKLLSNWSGPCNIGQPGTVVERNGFTLATAVSGTLVVDEGFEGGVEPTNWDPYFSGTGSVTADWGSTSSPAPKTGTYCAKIVAGAANNAYSYCRRMTTGLTSVPNGGEFWLSAQVYLDEATFRGVSDLLNIFSHCSIRLRSVTDRDGATVVTPSFYSADYLEHYGDPWGYVSVPLQAWFELCVRIKVSDETAPYKGEADVWINGRPALALRGVRTRAGTGGATNFSSFYLGAYNRAAATGTRTWSFDDVKVAMGTGAAAFDPRQPSTYRMAATRQLVLPEGVAT